MDMLLVLVVCEENSFMLLHSVNFCNLY